MPHSVEGHEAFFYDTKNMRAAVEFYRHVVGLQLNSENDYWSVFQLPDGARFGLHLSEGEPGAGECPMAIFRVADVRESTEHLQANGVRSAAEYIRQDWGEEADFYDLGGNQFRLARFIMHKQPQT